MTEWKKKLIGYYYFYEIDDMSSKYLKVTLIGNYFFALITQLGWLYIHAHCI